MTARGPGFNALVLGALATVATLLLALAHHLAQPAIAAAEREAREQVMWQAVAGSHEDLHLDAVAVPDRYRTLLGLPALELAAEGGELYIVRRQQTAVALIVPVMAQGYGGPIALVVGLDIHGVLTGVRVLSHRETPGLGDAIELRKSNWILGFNGKSLGNPAEDAWRIKKDGGHFDGLTGATVTPRAVVQQVHHALRYFAEDSARLLAPAPAQTSAPTAPSEKPHE